ncbi:MAG: PLP-dependent aminotransferase family protein [Thermodesulfobacteriota bacterium]
MSFRYIGLADEIGGKIENGGFRAGEKLPSLRDLHANTGLSLSTVYHAYIELEKRGMVEARHKSGFYVRPRMDAILPRPTMKRPSAGPRKVSVNALVEFILESAADPGLLPLGTAVAAAELMPVKALAKTIRSVCGRYIRNADIGYGPPTGSPLLRRQISRRSVGFHPETHEDDILITSGCMEAVQLCLRAVARTGDTVLVESPTFVCYLQLIEDLNMYALETPTDPETGIDLASVGQAIKKNRVSACILNPNFQNPLGFEMPDAAKQELVAMMARRNIPIIEDDIYGDLYFGDSRPATLKSHDRKGMVLHCSSFSKTLAPDLRIGWTLPGRFMPQVKRLKINSSMTTSKLNQLIIAAFLKEGAYDRHLRKLRKNVKHQMANTAQAVARYFPAQTRLTAPRGGFVLWVEMEPGVDGMQVFELAKENRIFVAPGLICSGTGKYRNCLRISCGHPFTAEMENGIRLLGDIVKSLSPAG